MNKTGPVKSISKILSPNDIGLTGAHQAGILIPKQDDVLSFFPRLNKEEKNPRFLLTFIDIDNERWDFSFIYYNNKFFDGTRNEYRLTRMTKFFRSKNLKVGDELFLKIDDDGIRRASYNKSELQQTGRLKLSTEWKVIKY